MNPAIPFYINTLVFLTVPLIIFFMFYSLRYARHLMNADKKKTDKTKKNCHIKTKIFFTALEKPLVLIK